MPRTLVRLSLTNCFEAKLISDLVLVHHFTFPPTLKHLGLARNDMTEIHLILLRGAWPASLISLDLSHSKFYMVVGPLPLTLHTLDVSYNRTMIQDVHPKAWIMALPPSLRELDVHGFNSLRMSVDCLL
ncbi:hypothetical protein AMAG_17632 [Allomyces macrogynus ATCC 38327]|uniref:Uncharacterized protein n=1 Tax=Allomyces macrogynus (strain ATCC 38327) TaxID=578462 RepID=A0A0L0RVM9_ALLM3|nr:hypothetical protein AMAG_17632 [Allomyces macrogynus ATCC 38327]|eukprot:KNE54199.1 hypothetical protein AMAG_17632 [Allomyces macrogynus ATCC 38327]